MNIWEITEKLNELASDITPFKDLQIIRAGINGWGRPRTYKIFSKSTIFEKGSIYAFHDGGRSETQFNIGVENFEGKEIFRYGICFSLEPNQSQPDPVNYLTPKIKAFNKFFQDNALFFDNLLLWHYNKPGHTGRSNDFAVKLIPGGMDSLGQFYIYRVLF